MARRVFPIQYFFDVAKGPRAISVEDADGDGKLDLATVGGGTVTVLLGNGAGTFVHAANELGYLNYVPNEEEISDYIHSYSGRIGPITTWFKKYPESLRYVDPKLEEIDRPVLVFWGAQDQLLLVENAERLKERLQRSKAHIFERCGHFSYQDQHEKFADLITEWVDGGYQRI